MIRTGSEGGQGLKETAHKCLWHRCSHHAITKGQSTLYNNRAEKTTAYISSVYIVHLCIVTCDLWYGGLTFSTYKFGTVCGTWHEADVVPIPWHNTKMLYLYSLPWPWQSHCLNNSQHTYSATRGKKMKILVWPKYFKESGMFHINTRYNSAVKDIFISGRCSWIKCLSETSTVCGYLLLLSLEVAVTSRSKCTVASICNNDFTS